jgi:hypothetical protein
MPGVRWLLVYGGGEILRYIFTVLFLLFALTLAACSFSTDFVVVNASEQPIEITYKIGETGVDPLVVTGKPATLPASQLSSREWQELSATQYASDREQRAVTVSLSPGLALRVYQGGDWSERETGVNFIIKELNIRGANGEVILKGDQVYKNFVAVPKPFYAFGPPTTLLTLTYK